MGREHDKKILTELAYRYAEIAFSDNNLKKISEHRDVNDLKSKKPILLIDEIPWHEMNIDNALTLTCEAEEARQIENFFRIQLFRHKYIPCDTVYRPYYAVGKAIICSGIGVEQKINEHQETAATHTYENQLKTEEDLEKLHNDTITYDRAATMASLEYAGEMIGDAIPVKAVGWETGYGLGLKNMDDIVNFCGLDTFFTDLIERPDFMHKLIGKLTDIFLDRMRQLEELQLLDADAYYCHSASALSNDLPKPDKKVTRKNLWGRGLAQIFASVSPEMQDEFDTPYMIKALSSFGLVYYGCCEPLDNKIQSIAKIPNLRKISVTPWANTEVCCEQIGEKYVVSAKPNPATLSFPKFDKEAVRAELTGILTAIKRNHCSADIVLKDITTVNGDPRNLIAWHDTAMETINRMF